MAEVNMQKAKNVFSSLVNMLDTRGWNYEKNENDLVIRGGIKGEDLPIEFIMVVNAKQEVVEFLSRLPFEMSPEKRVDGAVAVCVANDGLCDGSFDYNIESGKITFRLTTGFCGNTVLSEDLFEYMIMVSAATVDRYNDKFLMLSKGAVTLKQFIEQEARG